MKEIYISYIESPIGKIKAASTDKGICLIQFIDTDEIVENSDHEFLGLLENQLNEYFTKERKEFDLPLDLNGTDFQKKAWLGLKDVPHGQTISYEQQAQALNSPKAVRAVASANSKNPICIILPCHRVIGKNGKLTGYSGGLDRKEFLLKLEQELREDS